jgi:hypothetical protein
MTRKRMIDISRTLFSMKNNQLQRRDAGRALIALYASREATFRPDTVEEEFVGDASQRPRRAP